MLKIDNEFKSLIPELTPEEYISLKTSIKEEGCRDPLVIWEDHNIIVDGHNRYKICSEHNVSFDTVEREFEDRNAVKIWIIKNQFSRRNLSIYTKSVLALTLKPFLEIEAKKNQATSTGGANPQLLPNLAKAVNERQKEERNIYKQRGFFPIPKTLPGSVEQIPVRVRKIPIDTREEVAKIAGVSHGTIQKVQKIEKEAAPEIKAKIRRGDTSIHAEYKKIKQIEKQAAQVEKRTADLTEIDSNILVGDLRDLGKNIADDSVDFIFTDPPYGKENVKEYAALAELGKRVLKPGASLLVYCGQLTVPDVLQVITPHLTYHWTIAMQHTGQHQQLFGQNVLIGWKPIFWFTKGKRRDSTFVFDFVKSTQQKTHHTWQQGIDEALYYIEKLTIPGELVLDPFCGGGTTCVAAKQLGRKYLAFEIEENTARIASERLSND